MHVSVVIPNWNGVDKLKRNLPKVLEVEGIDEVIVVDDASSDDSVKVIKQNFPQVKLIEKQKNTGFGSNVNLGVSHAEGDFIFLLNTDAAPEKNCLRYILPHFEDEKIFSVGCNTGGSWSWARFEQGYLWHFQAAKKEKPVSHETLWASGGSAVFRKSIWQILDGFDPLFDPFYVEDLDLGYRAWKRGFKNIWEAKAQVEHYKSPGVIAQNFSKKRIYDTSERNMLLFIWKNIHDDGWLRSHLKALIKRLLTHPKYWLIFIAALAKLPQILEKRREEQSSCVVRDRQLLHKYQFHKLA